MEQDPNNAEVNADLKTARLQVEKAGGYKGFKKITIVEEEDEDANNEEQTEEVFLSFQNLIFNFRSMKPKQKMN